MSVHGLMSKDVVSIEHNDNVLSAVSLMLKHKVRHLPVIRNGQVIGMLSSDQLESLHGEFEKIKVGDICDRFLVFAYPESSMRDIKNAFKRLKLKALPVLNHWGHLVGLITAFDFAAA